MSHKNWVAVWYLFTIKKKKWGLHIAAHDVKYIYVKEGFIWLEDIPYF